MLKLEKFTYGIDNCKTIEKKELDNYTNPVIENDDVYTYINITLTYKYVTFEYTSSRLEAIKRSDWINLISQSGFEIDLADSYGSHCDNGNVTITNTNNEYLLFSNDTATGGDVRIKIPISECRNAIEEIASKY